ncbi:hypothetical protein OROHE_007252 [Orobanche hederae]
MFFEKIWDKVCISSGDRMKLIMKVDEVVQDNFYRYFSGVGYPCAIFCWGHIIKAVGMKSMGKEMNPSEDKGCIYGLGSLGIALSAPATSSSHVSRSQPPPS